MNRRKRHFITKTKGSVYPACIVTVEPFSDSLSCDSEYGRVNATVASWIASAVRYSSGIRQREHNASGCNAIEWWTYIDSLLRHHSNLWIASWNTPKTVRLLGLWEEMESRRCYLVNSDPGNASIPNRAKEQRWQGYAVLANPPTILHFKRRDLKGTITWIDMRNFGLSKLTAQENERISPHATSGVLTDILQFLKQNNLGSLRVTTGSQALFSFRYSYLKHSIHVSTNERQNSLARDCLIGGRNECYRVGRIQGPITQYDINSLYPAMYAKHSVPCRCRWITSNPSNSDIADALRGKNCIARILVETDIANVPKRDRRGTYFPIGRISTVVAWPELEIIIETCRRIKFLELATYDCCEALSSYATTLYPLRIQAKSNGSEFLAHYIKSLLVALSGKFGQTQKRWTISENQTCPGPWETWARQCKDGSIQRMRSLAWTVEEECDNGYSPEAVPEIAAWVNSWGRRTLWELMKRYGSDSIVYCDTDSIWTTGGDARDEVFVREYGGARLGDIRKVGRYDSCEFHGIRNYVADGKVTCSGAGSAFDMFGRWLYDIKPSQRIKPYTIGNVQADLSVTPIHLEEW